MNKNNDTYDNLWKYWNINDTELINEKNRLIKKSTEINIELIKFTINNIDDVYIFLKILSNDITELQTFHSTCGFFQYVSHCDKLRKAGFISDSEITKYNNQLNSSKELYDKIIDIKNKYINKLDKIDVRFLNKLIVNYERNGITLRNDKKLLLSKIKYEIIKLENAIMKYLSDHENDTIELTTSDLKGIPENIISTLHKITNGLDIYKIPLNKYNYNTLIKYINNSNLRKLIESHYTGRFDIVIDHICKLIVLRNKHAKTLGYNNHSDYKSFIQMTKNSDNIKNFLTELLNKLDFRYKREIDTILKLIKKNSNQENVNSWDIPYYVNKWKQEYGIDDNTIREYFELNNTLTSIIDIYQTVFDITFTKINNNKVWHPSVNVYSILNSPNNKLLGYLYLDLYARNGKYKQIRCFSLQQGTLDQTAIISLVASFNHTNNEPTLLTFYDMISLFHEIGHVIHNIFGKTKYSILSGINVETDFVETPAQMLEFLCWEKNIIKQISKHYITKEKISDDVINKIIKIKNLDIGLYYKKHIMIALYDQLIYSSDNFVVSCENILRAGNKTDLKVLLVNLYTNLHNEIMISNDNDPKYKIIINDSCNLPMEWINSLYSSDAQYYSSIWSKVLSSDMYSQKIKGKELNKNIGNDLKIHILQHGGSNDAYQMICNYMERKPAIDGFISMFDLDTDMEYSFFLNTDQIKSAHFKNSGPTAKTNVDKINNIKNNKQLKYDNHLDSVSNRFSEINESSINRNEFDNQTEEIEYIRDNY